MVSRVLGVLLLAAALLKANGLGVDPLARTGIFSATEFQVGVIEVEILLGIWLLSGAMPTGSWIICLALFIGFAGISFTLGLIGQASCGCFGRLQVSPWYAFVVDLLVLATLLTSRPDFASWRQDRRSLWSQLLIPAGTGVAAAAVVLGGFIGWAHWNFGSTDRALAYLRGERLSISPQLCEMGSGQAGQLQEKVVQVFNWTEQSVRIIGGTSDCSCVATDDLPLAIPAGESRSLTVKMRLPSALGIFTRSAMLLTDDDRIPRIGFRLTGRIVASEKRVAKTHTK